MPTGRNFASSSCSPQKIYSGGARRHRLVILGAGASEVLMPHAVRRARDVLGQADPGQQVPQPLLTARTSRRRRTSSIKRASKGEVLSRLHARASNTGMFKSTTGKTATV